MQKALDQMNLQLHHLAFLKHAYDNQQLRFPGTLAAFSKPGPFHAMLSTLRHHKWVV